MLLTNSYVDRGRHEQCHDLAVIGDEALGLAPMQGVPAVPERRGPNLSVNHLGHSHSRILGHCGRHHDRHR